MVHIAIFLIMLGAAYIAVAFFGVRGDWMMLVPALFVIYLGGFYLIKRNRKVEP